MGVNRARTTVESGGPTEMLYMFEFVLKVFLAFLRLPMNVLFDVFGFFILPRVVLVNAIMPMID